MSIFSEDSASSATPFSGDGSVFDHPDMLLQSPTTNERVVDTQSGYLVVLKRIGDRLALSCKRSVGTPPSSAVLLTPDESMKLSRILASSVVPSGDNSDVAIAEELSRRKFAFIPARQSAISRLLGKTRKPVLAAGVAIVAAILFAGGYFLGRQSPETLAGARDADPLSAESVDKFARRFMFNMLDFNADTYKQSQVHAMAAMSPPLLNKYWQETNFPLSSSQLKLLPQGATVAVDKIMQEHPAADTATADIFAQLIHPDQSRSPIRVKLQLAVGADQAVQVVGQQDLSGSPSGK